MAGVAKAPARRVRREIVVFMGVFLLDVARWPGLSVVVRDRADLKPALDAVHHGLGGDAVTVMEGRQGASIEEFVGQGNLAEGGREHARAHQEPGDSLS